MYSINSKLGLVVTLAVVVGVAAGFIHGHSTAQDSEEISTSIEQPVPKTMEELVSSSDLIVVGTLGRQVNQGTLYGYDAGAKWRADLDKRSLTPLGLPITDYEIEVDQVILTDDTAAEGRPVILRVIGEPGASSRFTPERGDRRLFFLAQNPDQVTYGLSSFMHQIDIEGSEAVYYKGNLSLLPFKHRVTPEEFIQRTKDLASQIRR